MHDPLIITQLRNKVSEIERQIEALEAQTAEARSALLHLAAVIRIFDPKASEDKPAAGYLNVTKALPRSQLFKRCQDALKASPEPLCTRTLARHVIVTAGWDIEDRKLRLSVAHRVGAMMASSRSGSRSSRSVSGTGRRCGGCPAEGQGAGSRLAQRMLVPSASTCRTSFRHREYA